MQGRLLEESDDAKPAPNEPDNTLGGFGIPKGSLHGVVRIAKSSYVWLSFVLLKVAQETTERALMV
jgi:hypothetical protein